MTTETWGKNASSTPLLHSQKPPSIYISVGGEWEVMKATQR